VPGGFHLIVLAAFVVVCAGAKLAQPILVPVVLGGFVATANAPISMWLRRRRVPLSLTIVLALTLDTLFLGAFLALVASSVGRLSSRLPDYLAVLKLAEGTASSWLQRFGTQRTLLEFFDSGEAIGLAATLFGQLASLLWNVVMALVIAGFLLWRFGRASRGGRPALIPSEPVRRAVREMNRYIAIKTVVGVVTGVLVGLYSWAVGSDLPVLFGLLAFLFNYIPHLGSIVAAIPAIGLALLQRGVEPALVLSAGYLVVNLFIGNVLEPRLLARALGLWPIVVLLSVIVWGWILGIDGAVLSSLLTSLLKIVLLATDDLRPLGLALGPRPPRREPQDLVEEALPQSRRAS
jgi:predicted PurR-regulated permease PerM